MPRQNSKSRPQEEESERLSDDSQGPRNEPRTDAEPGLGLLDMATLLSALQINGSCRKEIKHPQFTGEGDVEIFLAQFHEVAEANEWTERERLSHLRLGLTDKATECGREEMIHEVEEAL